MYVSNAISYLCSIILPSNTANIFIYIYMYTHIYIRTYVYMYMYIFIYIYTHTHTYIRTHTFIDSMYVRHKRHIIPMLDSTHVCMYVCMYVYMHIKTICLCVSFKEELKKNAP